MSEFNRDRALFGNGSRLYRQAHELTDFLFAELGGRDDCFRAPITQFCRKDYLRITSFKQAKENYERARDELETQCKELSGYHVIPGLIDATELFYGKASPELPAWIGQALKICIAATWPSVLSPSANQASHQKVLACVRMAGMVYQLLHICQVQILRPGMTTAVAPRGVVYGDIDAFHIFYRAFSKRGRIQRFAATTTTTIMQDQIGTIDAIFKVLSGRSPSRIKKFSGTVFEQIPTGEPIEFWMGILMRLLLLVAAGRARTSVCDDLLGVCLLEKSGIGLSDMPQEVLKHQASLQEAMEKCFWRRDWYRQRDRQLWMSMIVERPVIRVLATPPDLFACGVMTILDSINQFVESAIMRYEHSGNVVLSDSCYEGLVSNPFETDVIEVFRRHGFVAGEVGENAIWHTQHKHKNLFELSNSHPPGQLDLLAVHPNGYVIIGECKVLKMPMLFSQFRNLIKKVGETDDESFHSKLKRKQQWVDGMGNSLSKHFSGSKSFIILDRYLPNNDDFQGTTVCDLDTLDDAIAQLVKADV